MRIKEILSKERIANGLKKLGNLRVRINHTSLITLSALILILFIAFTIRIFPMRWEIETGSMHLSEFDPYYQYSLTKYMVENGLISPYWPPPGWRDYQRWYPDGINMARSFPALPMTAASLYMVVSALGVNIDLMSFCAFFPAIMGTLACIAIYFLGKDIGGKTVGLLGALFLALSPSYIQRTSLGFFDDETIGIFALLVFAITFLRAIEEERPISSTVKYSIASGAALAYFISGWGAAFYPIGLTVLFVFILILLKRYTTHLLLAYSITFGLGLFIAINVPFVSPTYLTSSAVLPVAGVFALLCLSEIFRNIKTTKSKVMVLVLFLAIFIAGFAVLWQVRQDIGGKFLSVIYPLARVEDPLVESVAEHRISAWGSIYYDLGVGIIFFLIGFFFLFRNPTNRNLFLLLYGLTSLYFACSMVRLLVLMSPAFSLLAAVGVLGILKPFSTLLKETPKVVTKKKFGLERVGKEFSGVAIFLIFLVLMTNIAFSPQSGGIPKVYRQAYAPVTITAGSLPIAPNAPVREWLDMLEWTRSNLQSTTVVCSWWDYGYWLSILGNVTSLADNATINTTQIENIGFVFMANETYSLKMLEGYDAKYILVFTTFDTSGNWIDWGGGDNGKWTWMARISGKAKDRFVNTGFIDADSAWKDHTVFGAYSNTTNRWEWNNRGTNTTIYKLMAWGKHRWCETNGVDDPDKANVAAPEYFKEAFFSGVNLSASDAQSKYGSLVPLVCLYEVDWQKYYAQQSS